LNADFSQGNAIPVVISLIGSRQVLMVRSTEDPSKREHTAALDGIRGYGFLAIFLAHYLAPTINRHRSNPWVDVLFYIEQLAWMAVPAFFVLSGYLIGGILFNSCNREGFFRVFYGRRILRILPVYYITLLVVGCVGFAHGVHLNYRFWAHFIYIQNLLPRYSDLGFAPHFTLIHLWSLAIEEQFYLTWPVVVWLARDRAKLLKIIAALCGLCFILRLISPWIHLTGRRCLYGTPTRVDAILLGVGLALVADHRILKQLQPLAKYAVLVGTALWLISFSTHVQDPDNYYRVVVETPLANFTVLALLVAVLEKDSVIARACSARWACWLGTMSYGLYVFHYTYHVWFAQCLRPMLTHYVGTPWDDLATAAIALTLTITLGMLSYRFIERPALSLTRYLHYGSTASTRPVQQSAPMHGLAADRT
jgi:peptidoglycan/LPS O-acetylase OafA/YrhL